jgi:hypothetical protein
MRSFWVGAGLGLAVIFWIIYFVAAPSALPSLTPSSYAGKAVADYGEPAQRGKVKEPVCYWSAIGFILAGLAAFLWMDLTQSEGPERLMSMPSVYSIPLALLMVWLGPGSMCEHGTLDRNWGWFDSTSVHWFALYVVCYLVFRLVCPADRVNQPLAVVLFFGAFLVLAVPIGILTWTVEGARFPFIVGLMGLLGVILLCLGVGWNLGSSNALCRFWQWLIPTAAFGAAGIAAQLSAGPLYKAGHITYLHAVWHVLIALVALFIYAYLRSEAPREGGS